jgi:hypothetical protein
MVVSPKLKTLEAVSEIMAATITDLHNFIESQSNDIKSEEMMALMMGFCMGLIEQLRDKVETLDEGLGDKFLNLINGLTNTSSKDFDIMTKLNNNDPSLNISASGIDPQDPEAAISYLAKKMLEDSKIRMDELPFILRNDNTLSYALALIAAHIFSTLDSKNVNALIDIFSENIRNFARHWQSNDKPLYH